VNFFLQLLTTIIRKSPKSLSNFRLVLFSLN